MPHLRLLIHAPGAPGLRWLGLGPGLRPARGLWKLQRLLDQHTFWAHGRSLAQLRQMLAGSAAVVSLWNGKRLVGFGRASSDGVFRAVLWDVVIPEDLQGQGLGRQLVTALLDSPRLHGVERVYLMTTNSAGFYHQLGFQDSGGQQLLVRPASPPSGSPSQSPAGRSSSPGCS
ncbi:GNAT family N-acetyltransferase [Vulcanococcus limneticus]|uniref:GNAT family N-acetyltransferase n=1 Tax=Vulcanococcus limneticus TaxID=2170428 RepID=UPI00398C0AD5